MSEREEYMRRQEAEHDMIRMRDPSRSIFNRGPHPDPLADELRTLRAENEKLREYAREATKAITSLTAGGSEYFGRKIGDIYTADLPFCLERIQRSKDLLHSLIKDERARTKAAEVTIDRMIADRATLSEAQS